MTYLSLWPNCVLPLAIISVGLFWGWAGGREEGGLLRWSRRGYSQLAVSGYGLQHVAPFAVPNEGDGRCAVAAEV